jgi:serine/threonine-protein kinase
VCGTALPDPNVGRIVAGRYKLFERVGSGSLGVVYRAEQMGLGRRLAIKLLSADASRDPRTVERFRREGEVLCRLRSAHTVTTYEFDHEPDGSLYIAMELSPGRSLAEVFRTAGTLDWPRVLRILDGLCDSLGEAHGLGIVHRGIKPENILLEDRPASPDFVKVLDFGLAKVVSASQSLSPAQQTVSAVEYSSPEQLLQRRVDARSDLYSLGVLGYLLITGRHPFPEARSFGDMVAAHIHRIPPMASTLKPGIPDAVDVMLARCLDKDPARRYPDTAALAAAIAVSLSVPADTIPETGWPP